MGELGHVLGDCTTIPAALCAVLVLRCVLRRRDQPSRSVTWLSYMVTLLECCRLLPGCQGRGRLVDPPSRASMWRFGFVNPVDFNDDRVDCGGFARQWRKNRGRCGVCGDPWDESVPRPHETRGKYGRGTIVRTYTQAQVVVVEEEVTAPSTGHFEYRLCPRGSVWTPETQDCFKYLLQDDQGRSQIPISVSHKFARMRHVLRLPQGVSCPACVLQRKLVTMGRDGRAEYRACADIAITSISTADSDADTNTTTTTTSVTAVTISTAMVPVTDPFSATTVASSNKKLDTSKPADDPHSTDTTVATLEEPRPSPPTAHTTLHNGMLSDTVSQGENGGVGAQRQLYEIQNDDSDSNGNGGVGAQTRLQGELESDGGNDEGRGGAATFPAALHYAVVSYAIVLLYSGA